MTLEEAIEEYEFRITYHHGQRPVSIAVQAAQLGIEALKRFKQYRMDIMPPGGELLPGETKE